MASIILRLSLIAALSILTACAATWGTKTSLLVPIQVDASMTIGKKDDADEARAAAAPPKPPAISTSSTSAISSMSNVKIAGNGNITTIVTGSRNNTSPK